MGPGREPPFDLRFECANENRQATIGLGGTGVAILTLLRLFLSGRHSAPGFPGLHFRGTLAAVVLSIFFLGLSGSHYYFLIEALERGGSDAPRFQARTDLMFVAGLALLLLEPALILITAGIWDVGLLAIALWAISLGVIARGRSGSAGPPSAAPI